MKKPNTTVRNKSFQKYANMRAPDEICKGVVYYKGWAMITNKQNFYAKRVGEDSYAEDELEGFIQFKDGRSIPADPTKLEKMDLWHQSPEENKVETKYWSDQTKAVDVATLKRYDNIFGSNERFCYRLNNGDCYCSDQLIQFFDLCEDMGFKTYAYISWDGTPALYARDGNRTALCTAAPPSTVINVYNNETGEFEDSRYSLVRAHNYWSEKVKRAKSESTLTRASLYVEEVERLIEKWKNGTTN